MKTRNNLTDFELTAVNELRNRVYDELKDEEKEDIFLFYRFLKARDFDMEESEKMLRNMLQWKKSYNFESIDTYKPPTIMMKTFTRSQVGYDKEGSIIFYLKAGREDLKGLRMSARYADIEKTYFMLVHKAEKDMKEIHGKKVLLPGSLLIFDFEGFGWDQASDVKSHEYFLRISKKFLDYFPESVKALFFLNVSPGAVFIYSLLKSMFPSVLINKIKLYTTDEYKEDLLKLVDRAVLPAFLGGSRTDPDGNPLCKTLLHHGGPIPESYYIHRSKRALRDNDNVHSLTVAKGSSAEVEVRVDKPGDLLTWEFETRTGEIQFSVVLRGGDGTDVEVVAARRCNTDDFSDVGEYRCVRAGTYIAVFNNTSGWFRSKEVFYKFVVQKDSSRLCI